MFAFLRIQYILGNITREQLQSFVPRWITQQQAEEIAAEPVLPGA